MTDIPGWLGATVLVFLLLLMGAFRLMEPVRRDDDQSEADHG